MRILLAVDFSSASLRALREVEALAPRLGAEVVLVHVFSPPEGPDEPVEAEGDVPVLPYRVEMSEAHAVDWCNRWAEPLVAAGCQVTVLVRQGMAETAILEAAEAHDVALVVVGRRGLGRLRRLALGSVSQFVTAHSTRPVLVVPQVRD